MSDWEDGNESEGFKGLRKAYKQQGQELAEVKTQLATLLADKQSQNIADALASRGFDPRIARFYPKDAPTDDASVDVWVENNGPLFGSRQVVTDGQPDNGTLTDSEMRGYQIQKDVAAYDNAVQLDLKSRLDKIEYDPQNPDKAQNELLTVLKEFEGVVNK